MGVFLGVIVRLFSLVLIPSQKTLILIREVEFSVSKRSGRIVSAAVRPPVVLADGSRAMLTRREAARLAHAEAMAKSGHKADLRMSASIVRDVEAEIAARVQERQLGVANTETVRLEIGRGGDVDHLPEMGLCRMKDRDGLRSLFEAGKLDKAGYETGLVYRRATEKAFGGGRSQLAERSGSGGETDVVGSGFTKAKAGMVRSKIDIAVALQMKDEPAGLATLRRVAGEGHAVRTMVSGSRGFDRHVKALVTALRVADAVLAEIAQKGIDERHKS